MISVIVDLILGIISYRSISVRSRVNVSLNHGVEIQFSDCQFTLNMYCRIFPSMIILHNFSFIYFSQDKY